MSKLARLKPAGTAETLGAMTDDQGNIITNREDMADLLRNHWSQVFCHKNTSKAITKNGSRKHTQKGHHARLRQADGNPRKRT